MELAALSSQMEKVCNGSQTQGQTQHFKACHRTTNFSYKKTCVVDACVYRRLINLPTDNSRACMSDSWVATGWAFQSTDSRYDCAVKVADPSPGLGHAERPRLHL